MAVSAEGHRRRAYGTTIVSCCEPAATLFSKLACTVATYENMWTTHVTTPAYFKSTIGVHMLYVLSVVGMQQVGEKTGLSAKTARCRSKGARHPSALTNTPEDDRRVNDEVQELLVSLIPLHGKRLRMPVIRHNRVSAARYEVRIALTFSAYLLVYRFWSQSNAPHSSGKLFHNIEGRDARRAGLCVKLPKAALFLFFRA